MKIHWWFKKNQNFTENSRVAISDRFFMSSDYREMKLYTLYIYIYIYIYKK